MNLVFKCLRIQGMSYRMSLGSFLLFLMQCFQAIVPFFLTSSFLLKKRILKKSFFLSFEASGQDLFILCCNLLAELTKGKNCESSQFPSDTCSEILHVSKLHV